MASKGRDLGNIVSPKTGIAVTMSGDPIVLGVGNTERLRITSAGSVGIGTDNPSHEVHLQGSGDTRVLITSGGIGDAVMMFENASGNTWGHGIDLTNNNYVIAYNSTSDPSLTVNGKVEITTAGDVGIGTETPTGTNALTDNTATLAVGVATVGALHVNSNAYPSVGPLSNRNLIINAAMRVAQRGTSVTGVNDWGYYTCDRWRLGNQNLGTYTVTQESDGPADFTKSLKVECTTADASPANDDYLTLMQLIEAQDLQHLSFGNANAKSLIISFYVKSNKTGGASFEVQQKDNSDRQVSFQYTINSADTWEKKTISIPADTSGVINDDDGTGLRVLWWLNSGSTYSSGSHVATWAAEVAADRNVSNLGVGGAVGDYFQITGVQLETGSVATPFEHRCFSDELAKCQRYYVRFNNDTTSLGLNAPGYYNTSDSIFFIFYFPIAMRDDISLDYSNISDFDIEPWDYQITSLSILRSTPHYASLTCTPATNRSQGDVAFLTIDVSNSWIAFDAELT